jgi:hypothetical protein
MKIQGNLTVTKTQRVQIEVTAQDILDLVRQRVHVLTGVSVAIRVYVDVPGGEDWSNTQLDIHDHPVHVRFEWSEVTDGPSEQG